MDIIPLFLKKCPIVTIERRRRRRQEAGGGGGSVPPVTQTHCPPCYPKGDKYFLLEATCTQQRVLGVHIVVHILLLSFILLCGLSKCLKMFCLVLEHISELENNIPRRLNDFIVHAWEKYTGTSLFFQNTCHSHIVVIHTVMLNIV